MIKYNSLITGITGQDGIYLAQLLLNKGYNVYGLKSNNRVSSYENFSKVGININQINFINEEDLPSIIQDGFEIYNFSAQSSVGYSWTNPTETFNSNTIQFINLIEKVKNKSVKILQASSAEMYDPLIEIRNESSAMRTQNPYALSKLTSFLYSKMLREQEHLWISNAILFNHESVLRNEKFVSKKIINGIRKIKNGESDFIELGNIDIFRDWGFAQDYVEIMWKMLQLENTMDINIATGKAISLRQFIIFVFKYFEISNYERYIKINPTFIRPTETKYIGADVSLLKHTFNINLEPISESSIKRLIEP